MSDEMGGLTAALDSLEVNELIDAVARLSTPQALAYHSHVVFREKAAGERVEAARTVLGHSEDALLAWDRRESIVRAHFGEAIALAEFKARGGRVLSDIPPENRNIKIERRRPTLMERAITDGLRLGAGIHDDLLGDD